MGFRVWGRNCGKEKEPRAALRGLLFGSIGAFVTDRLSSDDDVASLSVLGASCGFDVKIVKSYPGRIAPG